ALFACSKISGHDLIDLHTVNPRILIDMRYAGYNNPLGFPIYPFNRCFVVYEVAKQLNKVQQALEKEGYGLKVYDAYRPYHLIGKGQMPINPILKEIYPSEDTYGRCRGTSVDVTLVIIDGGHLDMGTPFGHYSAKTHRDCTTLPAHIYHNRQKL